MSFNPTAYKNEYDRENYERVSFNVPKGKRAILKEYAEKKGISVNLLIAKAVEKYTGIPLSKD